MPTSTSVEAGIGAGGASMSLPGDAAGLHVEAGVERCPAAVDCAVPGCDGVACDGSGKLCDRGECACLPTEAAEFSCGDGKDNDCDGARDCADPDCDRTQCGASPNTRCCAAACVDTETDPNNCQGCGLACAQGQLCVRISDQSGARGHCTCLATTDCPNAPAQICRQENGDGQDDLCACDVVATGNQGCAEGQACLDVPAANFCRY